MLSEVRTEGDEVSVRSILRETGAEREGEYE
jgi:hypothetical protein